MIAPHSPREVDDGTAGIGVMHLLPVGQYQPFAGGDAPDQRDVVLFAAAGRAGFAGGESVGVGKAETPSDATFGVGDAFAAGYGGEVDGVEGSLGGGAGGGGDRHDYFLGYDVRNRCERW